VRRWALAGADLILGGHIHLPFVCPLHERVPGIVRPVWAVQAGTAVSKRVRPEAPNSVNLLRLPERAAVRGCAVERWDYEADRQAFGLAAAYELQFDVACDER
jgi:hypothetical protein